MWFKFIFPNNLHDLYLAVWHPYDHTYTHRNVHVNSCSCAWKISSWGEQKSWAKNRKKQMRWGGKFHITSAILFQTPLLWEEKKVGPTLLWIPAPSLSQWTPAQTLTPWPKLQWRNSQVQSRLGLRDQDFSTTWLGTRLTGQDLLCYFHLSPPLNVNLCPPLWTKESDSPQWILEPKFYSTPTQDEGHSHEPRHQVCSSFQMLYRLRPITASQLRSAPMGRDYRSFL